jgi:hypothetical protein
VAQEMSNASKGKAYEREAREILESEGWLVEKAIPKTQWVGPGRQIAIAHDFFNCWDLIGKRKEHKTLWVQVSTWEMVSVKRKQVASFPWTSAHDEPVIYARVRGRNAHFRLLYGRNGYEWIGDIKMLCKRNGANDGTPQAKEN